MSLDNQIKEKIYDIEKLLEKEQDSTDIQVHTINIDDIDALTLADMIDHTLLKADATREQLRVLCQEAITHSFRTVCVNSCNIPFCSELLRDNTTMPIAVVGFPLGAMHTQAKAFETELAVSMGAQEIDMVINVGALKEGRFHVVYDDIAEVVDAAAGRPVKVILETSLLEHHEKIAACVMAKAANAAFVKTSTGFSGGGATTDDIKLMRFIVGEEMGVKASGGVRTREDAITMLKAGANRIGASASVAIVGGDANENDDY